MKFLSFKDVLRRVPISRRTWQRYANDGRAPAPWKIGKRVFWTEEQAEEWLAEHAPSNFKKNGSNAQIGKENE